MHDALEDDPVTRTGDSVDRRLGAAWCRPTLNALRDTLSGPWPLSPCHDGSPGLSRHPQRVPTGHLKQPPSLTSELSDQRVNAQQCSRYTSLPDADLQQQCCPRWVRVDSMHQTDRDDSGVSLPSNSADVVIQH